MQRLSTICRSSPISWCSLYFILGTILTTPNIRSSIHPMPESQGTWNRKPSNICLWTEGGNQNTWWKTPKHRRTNPNPKGWRCKANVDFSILFHVTLLYCFIGCCLNAYRSLLAVQFIVYCPLLCLLLSGHPATLLKWISLLWCSFNILWKSVLWTCLEMVSCGSNWWTHHFLLIQLYCQECLSYICVIKCLRRNKNAIWKSKFRMHFYGAFWVVRLLYLYVK